jgi:hypothetical protein
MPAACESAFRTGAEFQNLSDIILLKPESPAMIIGDEKLDCRKVRDRATKVISSLLQPERAFGGGRNFFAFFGHNPLKSPDYKK